VDQRQHIRQEIRATSRSIAEKIAALEGRVEDQVSLGHHVSERPLLLLGGAFALGVALDRLLF
jgi:hypothetical protein